MLEIRGTPGTTKRSVTFDPTSHLCSELITFFCNLKSQFSRWREDQNADLTTRRRRFLRVIINAGLCG